MLWIISVDCVRRAIAHVLLLNILFACLFSRSHFIRNNANSHIVVCLQFIFPPLFHFGSPLERLVTGCVHAGCSQRLEKCWHANGKLETYSFCSSVFFLSYCSYKMVGNLQNKLSTVCGAEWRKTQTADEMEAKLIAIERRWRWLWWRQQRQPEKTLTKCKCEYVWRVDKVWDMDEKVGRRRSSEKRNMYPEKRINDFALTH